MKTRESLKKRVLRGGAWLSLGSGFEYSLRFLRNAILARIIAPEAFGEMAIILAMSAAFESLTQIGIKEAIIQSPEGEENHYLNSTWWISVLRSLGLYAAGYAAAPWLAGFYNNPDLLWMMRLAFLGIVFNGAMSVRAYVTVKRMKFREWILIYHGGGVIGILVALVLAFYLRNVWALVIGFTVESAARFLLSYIITPFLPGLSFKKESLKALLRYSRGMIGLPVLTFIFMRTDIFVAGKMVTPAALGLYTMASSLARMPFRFLASVLNRIMMPMFSEIQDDMEAVNRALLKITKVILYTGTPFLVFSALYGKELLTIVYGPKYAPVFVPFTIIVGLELLRMGSVPMAAVYLSLGRPELHRLFTAVRALVIVLVIYPAILEYELAGAAAAGLIAMIIGYIMQAWRIRGLTGLDLGNYVLIFLKGLAFSCIVFIPWFLTPGTVSSNPYLSIVPGIVGYGLSVLLAGVVLLRPGKFNLGRIFSG